MEKDTNEWKYILCSWVRKINIVKMSILSKTIYRFNAISIKIPVAFVIEMAQTTPKFVLLLFSCSVMSNSLQPHGLQHARLPCPSPSPGACSCPLSQSCHATISLSVVPFSCLQSFPASGSLPMSRLFTSGGQSIGASISISLLLINSKD